MNDYLMKISVWKQLVVACKQLSALAMVLKQQISIHGLWGGGGILK